MMPNLNQIQIIGNVGSDVEMRFTPSGKPVTTFSLAANHSYKKDDEWQEETTWFKIIAWGKLAELCNERVVKGDPIFAQGRVTLRKWEGKEGKERSSLEVIADKVVFLTKHAKEQVAETESGADSF